MTTVGKVAVSIPREILEPFERARRRLQKTRSAAVTEAIENWLRSEGVADEDQRYIEGYRRVPERDDETAAIAVTVARNWEPWE